MVVAGYSFNWSDVVKSFFVCIAEISKNDKRKIEDKNRGFQS